MNLPYCIATYLLEGDCFVAQFSEDKVADPSRIALSRRVEVREDPDITRQGAKFRHTVRVEVELVDGTKLTRTVESARGSERRFASDEEIIAKFHKLAGNALDDARRQELCDTVLDLERVADASMLARLLTA